MPLLSLLPFLLIFLPLLIHQFVPKAVEELRCAWVAQQMNKPARSLILAQDSHEQMFSIKRSYPYLHP